MGACGPCCFILCLQGVEVVAQQRFLLAAKQAYLYDHFRRAHKVSDFTQPARSILHSSALDQSFVPMMPPTGKRLWEALLLGSEEASAASACMKEGERQRKRGGRETRTRER